MTKGLRISIARWSPPSVFDAAWLAVVVPNRHRRRGTADGFTSTGTP